MKQGEGITKRIMPSACEPAGGIRIAECLPGNREVIGDHNGSGFCGLKEENLTGVEGEDMKTENTE